MSRIVRLQLLRATKTELDKIRDASGFFLGEPYFVTDEARIAVASAVNQYRTMVKREGDTMLGKLSAIPAAVGGAGLNLGQGVTPVPPIDGDIWITPDGFYHRSNNVSFKMVSEGGLPQQDDLVINGDFYFNTPGDTWVGGIVSGVMQPGDDFICDQWRGFNTTDATATMLRNATPPLISKYGNPLQLTINATTADASLAATQLLMFRQYFDTSKFPRLGWGFDTVKPDIYVRFTARTNVAGTYYISLISADGAISYVAPWTIAAGEVNTAKEFVIRIPAPPLGSPGVWNAGTPARSGMLAFSFASGDTYKTATINAWGAGGKYVGTGTFNPLASAGFNMIVTDIAMGQMVSSDAGLVAPPYRRKPYNIALEECRRFYQTIQIMYSGDSTANVTYYASDSWTTPMAYTPTVVFITGSQSIIFPAAVAPPGVMHANIAHAIVGPAVRESRRAYVSGTVVGANTTPAAQNGAYFYSTLGLNARL